MAVPRKRRLRRFLVSSLLLGMLAALGWAGAAWWRSRPRRPGLEAVRTTPARRIDLHATLTAPGRIDSADRTLIECQLENLSTGASGQTFTAGGSSTIIDIIPEGTVVQKDDVLVRLDASDYEELVRQQEIKVEQARSDHQKATLDLQAAELALKEYREGQLALEQRQFQSQILLAEADLRRQADRVQWAERMLGMGYLPAGKLADERQTYRRSELNLANLRGGLANLDRFGGPIALRQFQSAVETARSYLTYQDMRLRRQGDVLARFRRQVEACTIRAPHDGLVVYANEPDGDPKVQPGARVYQKMDLMYLPDLTHMQVHATIHESVIKRVREGMSTWVRIEGLGHQEVEGHVLSVAPLPILDRGGMAGRQVNKYLGKIELHSVPRGLVPGMSAEVEIATAHQPNALVIPREALTVEGGREVCYLRTDEGLVRREVATGFGTNEVLEVTDGLDDGDEVVLDPGAIDPALVVREPETPAEPGPETAMAHSPAAIQ